MLLLGKNTDILSFITIFSRCIDLGCSWKLWCFSNPQRSIDVDRFFSVTFLLSQIYGRVLKLFDFLWLNFANKSSWFNYLFKSSVLQRISLWLSIVPQSSYSVFHFDCPLIPISGGLPMFHIFNLKFFDCNCVILAKRALRAHAFFLQCKQDRFLS